jgi:hypothetical protein
MSSPASPQPKPPTPRKHPVLDWLLDVNWKHFLILWVAVFVVEFVAGRMGFDDKLREMDQTLTRSLVGLDPFTLSHDFYGRLSDPHSLKVWSLTAPFNVRVHDDQILAQMRDLREGAPGPPAKPITFADRIAAGGRALALGDSTDTTFPTEDKAAEELANAQYQSACQDYLSRFLDWQQAYHQLALGLSNFDASAYSEEMSRSCGETQGTSNPLLSGLSGTGFYDTHYSSDSLIHGDAGSNWVLLQVLWHFALGLPDALLFTVWSAFGRGVFQSILAVILLLLTFGVVAKKWPILIFILPLLAGCFGWILLELVRFADLLLKAYLPAPGIQAVATAALWPLSALVGFIESFFSIVKHNIAHKIAEEVEHHIGK